MSAVHVRVRVGDENYALPVENVLEVGELGRLAAVPGAPAACLGVRNLRGEILPVFDLATVLGLAPDHPPARVVVAEDDGRRAGFAIDDVTDVVQLPDALEDAESKFLAGATFAGDELVGVLDLTRLFDALEGKDAA